MSVTAMPELVVFDLDYTLWDCGGMWIDCTSPPFQFDSDGEICDSEGRRFRLYPDVEAIMDSLDEADIPMALASRTSAPDWANEVLEMMGILERFAFSEIYPDCKVTHFNALKQDSGIDFSAMLFFDDEQRNITEVGELGVKCVFVTHGIDQNAYQSGLEKFG